MEGILIDRRQISNDACNFSAPDGVAIRENSTRYNRTRNFGICGDAEGKKTGKICLPLVITTKSDFVFAQPRPKADIGHRYEYLI
jgi:hypothetical protein